MPGPMKVFVLSVLLALYTPLASMNSPFLGIFIDDNPARNGGVIVDEVIPESPAAKAGISAGDIVVKINDLPITDGEILREVIHNHRIGEHVQVEIVSNGNNIVLDIVLEERNDAFLPDISIFNTKTRHLGLKLQQLTDQLMDYFGVQNGVLVAEVIPGTPAEAAGISAGDVIISVSDELITCTEDVLKILQRKNSGDLVTLQITRDKQVLTVEAEVAETESLISLDVDSKIIFLGKDQLIDIPDLQQWFSSVMPDTTHRSVERQLEELQQEINKIRKRLLTK